MKTFHDWLKANGLSLPETSAFERARKADALGLGPELPDAALNSRSTMPPGLAEIRKKRKGKGKKHKKHDDEE